MKIYKENIERFKEFYQSDYYKKLTEREPYYIQSIFELLNDDPDYYDEELYQELGKKFHLKAFKQYLEDEVDGQKIRLLADMVCGRKQIVSLYKDEMDCFEKWVSSYEKIRSNLDLHFIWPKHRVPTINTYRYIRYLDRIDLTLLDLKLFFEGFETPMKRVYSDKSEGRTTAIWLEQFEHFKLFIDKMQLNDFVNKNYEVLDISKSQKEILKEIPTREEIKESLPNYLQNLILLFGKTAKR